MADYRRLDYQYQDHCRRYRQRVLSMPRPLACQECGGAGGHKEIVIVEEGSGPWFDCGFCRGSGYVTPHDRGQWLRWKKQEKVDG